MARFGKLIDDDDDPTAATGSKPAPASTTGRRSRLTEWGRKLHDKARERSPWYAKRTAWVGETEPEARHIHAGGAFWTWALLAGATLVLAVYFLHLLWGAWEWLPGWLHFSATLGQRIPQSKADFWLTLGMGGVLLFVGLVGLRRPRRYPRLLSIPFLLAVIGVLWWLWPVLLSWGALQFMAAWQIYKWMLLLGIPLWIIVRYSWRIGRLRQLAYLKEVKRVDGTPERPLEGRLQGVVSTWWLAFVLALFVASFPTGAGAANKGFEPEFSRPAVAQIDPKTVCAGTAEGNSAACAAALSKLVNDERGTLDRFLGVCASNDEDQKDPAYGSLPQSFKDRIQRRAKGCGDKSSREALNVEHQKNVSTVCHLLEAINRPDDCNGLK